MIKIYKIYLHQPKTINQQLKISVTSFNKEYDCF